MLDNINALFPFVLVFGVVVMLMSVTFFVLSQDFEEKRMRFYSLFINMGIREALLVACSFLEFLFVLVFAIDAKNYNDFFGYLILAVAIVSVLAAFNIRIILLDVIFVVVTIFALKLLKAISEYLLIFDEQSIMILKVLLMAVVIIFVGFIVLRKIENIARKNRYVKRSEG